MFENRIGAHLVRIAQRRILDIQDAIAAAHPKDIRQRDKLENDLAEARSSLQFRRECHFDI